MATSQSHVLWTASLCICGGALFVLASNSGSARSSMNAVTVTQTSRPQLATLGVPKQRGYPHSDRVPRLPTSVRMVNADNATRNAASLGPAVTACLMGSVAAFLAVGFRVLRRLSNESLPLLQPITILPTTALYDMKDPADALTLWKKQGFTILDIRAEMERSEGRIRGVFKVAEVPLITTTSAYDPRAGRVVVDQQPNADWLNVMKSRFPNPNSKLIVMCSDGTNRTRQALDLLASAGYRNLVGMTGGFKKWDQMFDRQQRPRPKEAQMARAATQLPDPVDWLAWNAAGAPQSAYQGAAPVASGTEGESGWAAASATRSATFPVVEYAAYQDPGFQAMTIAAFPAKRNATVEEARVLWKLDNYSILDLRSPLEGDDGRIQGPNKRSVDIPMFLCESRYDATLGCKVVTQAANKDWLRQVEERFPNKDARIVLMCSDGNDRSTQALELLAADGYNNLVRMVGGYNRWDQVFDSRLALRTPQQQAAKVDWLVDHITWNDWLDAVLNDSPPQQQVVVQAPSQGLPVAMGLYQDPAFHRTTIAAFPAKRDAGIEEARVLWKLDGYSIIDVRSELEGREGRIRGPNKRSIDIPLFNAVVEYDSQLGKKVLKQTPNTSWLQQLKERFPQNSKLIIMCSDGSSRSTQAMELLAAEGYPNVVRMVGGYNGWDQVFDPLLALRSPQEQAARSSNLVDPVIWNKWAPAVGDVAAPAKPVAPAVVPPSQAAKIAIDVALQGAYADPTFQAATIAAFPARVYANVEEARVLWKLDDYALVDIRSAFEGQEGRIRGPNKGSIDIPMFHAKAVFDPASGQRVVKTTPNLQWLELMQSRFPKDTKIVLFCADGTNRSEQALKTLRAAGYPNVVVMAGGYNKWDQIFDNRLALRNVEVQARKAAALADPLEWGTWSSQ